MSNGKIALSALLADYTGDPDGIDVQSLTRPELYSLLKYYSVKAEVFAEYCGRLSRDVVSKPHDPDHACRLCVPDGEIVRPGFQCTYHFALGFLGTTARGREVMR